MSRAAKFSNNVEVSGNVDISGDLTIGTSSINVESKFAELDVSINLLETHVSELDASVNLLETITTDISYISGTTTILNGLRVDCNYNLTLMRNCVTSSEFQSLFGVSFSDLSGTFLEITETAGTASSTDFVNAFGPIDEYGTSTTYGGACTFIIKYKIDNYPNDSSSAILYEIGGSGYGLLIGFSNNSTLVIYGGLGDRARGNNGTSNLFEYDIAGYEDQTNIIGFDISFVNINEADFKLYFNNALVDQKTAHDLSINFLFGTNESGFGTRGGDNYNRLFEEDERNIVDISLAVGSFVGLITDGEYIDHDFYGGDVTVDGHLDVNGDLTVDGSLNIGSIYFTGHFYKDNIEFPSVSSIIASNALLNNQEFLTLLNNQNMNDASHNYTWAGTGDGTYLENQYPSTTAFECVTAGYYNLSVILHCTDGSANDRSMVYGYVLVRNSKNIELKRSYLGSSYYRDNESNSVPAADDLIISGGALIYLNSGDTFTIVTQRAYSQDASDTIMADKSESRLYCEYVGSILREDNSELDTSVNLLETITTNISHSSADSKTVFNNDISVNGDANISSDLTVGGDAIAARGVWMSSDNRLKHNESTLENALEDIRQLTPLHYFKTREQYEKDYDFSLNELGEPLDSSGNVLTKNKDYYIESGFIAQDVYEIPNLKFTLKINDASFNDASMSIYDISSTLALDYNSITVHSIAALQEIDRQLIAEKEKTATLETEVTTLKTQMSELLARVSSLETNNSTTTTDASDNTTSTDGS